MHRLPTLPTLTFAFACLLVAGCGDSTRTADADSADDAAQTDDGAAPDGADEGEGHVHDDVLFWQRQELEHAGFQINLGHHGEMVYADHDLEPAVGILRDGEPVEDAQVFVSLLDADKNKVLAKETATVYEPPTSDEPAHYAQGVLAVPKSITKAVIRYRIEWPEAAPFQYDVLVDVDQH